MESVVPICDVCGEQARLNGNGNMFVDCRKCNFLICNACVDSEIKEGRQICLRCGNPYGN